MNEATSGVALADELKNKFLQNETLTSSKTNQQTNINDEELTTRTTTHQIVEEMISPPPSNVKPSFDVSGKTQGGGIIGAKTKKEKKSVKLNYAQKFDMKNVGLGQGALRASRPSTEITKRRPGSPDEFDLEEPPVDQSRNLEEDEKLVRNKNLRSPLRNFCRSSAAALLVFLVYLITLETILSCAFTVGLTMFWFHQYKNGGPTSTWNGSGMDWVLLGFAVVTPITVSIGLAFRRREWALYEIRRVRSSAFQIYLAHALWDWSKGGRKEVDVTDWIAHTDTVMSHLIAIGDELCRFLTLPTSSRSSNRMLRSGRREAGEIVEVAYRLFDSLYTQRIIELSKLTEQLKQLGLSPSEASRIRQYERFIGEAVEGLRAYKMYRTPQALRAFGRIFTVILPPFYAPTFAQLAFDLNSLGMGLLFALVTPLCLTALFESTQALEDPFVGYISLDGINVKEEFEVLHWHQMMNARNAIYPQAPAYVKTSENAIDSFPRNVQDDNYIFAPTPGSKMDIGSMRSSHFTKVLGNETDHKNSLRSWSERHVSS